MRILLVTYYFAPFNSVGAVRPCRFARWLRSRGHQVHVLTCSNQPFPKDFPSDLPAEQITAVPAWSINAPVEWLRGGRQKVARQGFGATAASGTVVGRLGRLYKTVMHWPDGQMGWVGAATRAGRLLMRGRSFDLIYASAPPFSVLRVAQTLSRVSGVPWVAELRDLWTDNHAYDAPVWRRALDLCWESHLLRSASALVTVSAPLVDRLRRLDRPVWEVRNGYDPEDFDALACPPGLGADPDTLDIAFTGNVYDRHYDVDAFCAGVALDTARGGRVKVHVAGRNVGALRAAAERHRIQSSMVFHDTVPRPLALAMQRHADLLLTFLWNDPLQQGVYSSKLFEYAGAGRPVLAVGPCNDVGALILESGLGGVCTDADQVAQALAAARSRKSREGVLFAQPSEDYDFTSMSQFAALLPRLQGLLPSAPGAAGSGT